MVEVLRVALRPLEEEFAHGERGTCEAACEGVRRGGSDKATQLTQNSGEPMQLKVHGWCWRGHAQRHAQRHADAFGAVRRVAEAVLSQTKSFRTASLALLSILRERGKHVGTSSLSRRRWNLQLCLHEKVHGHTLRMSLLSIIPWHFDSSLRNSDKTWRLVKHHTPRTCGARPSRFGLG